MWPKSKNIMINLKLANVEDNISAKKTLLRITNPEINEIDLAEKN